MITLTEEQSTKLQAYSTACDELNKIHADIGKAKSNGADTFYLWQAYYDQMHQCDELLAWFTKQGLDAEKLLEELSQ